MRAPEDPETVLRCELARVPEDSETVLRCELVRVSENLSALVRVTEDLETVLDRERVRVPVDFEAVLDSEIPRAPVNLPVVLRSALLCVLEDPEAVLRAPDTDCGPDRVRSSCAARDGLRTTGGLSAALEVLIWIMEKTIDISISSRNTEVPP